MRLISVRLMLLLPMYLALMGCDDQSALAPVVESRSMSLNKHQLNYTVRRGDTLYAVAFRYDKDFQQLAAFNQLRSPYVLREGQVLHLQYPERINRVVMQRARVIHPQQLRGRSQPKVLLSQVQRDFRAAGGARQTWSWPASGRVINRFNPTYGKKGIDLAGKRGDGVYAAASGVVAYSGSGIAGYGNLILIKHNNRFLTAYGYNARNLVHEGQVVRQHQRIADMGMMDRRQFGLHFEMRQAGKPVNPLSFLNGHS